MIIQIEDCIDCLQLMYPQFDYEFELDHSSGHNSERVNDLSTSSMNLGWGAKQRRMRKWILTKDDLGELVHDKNLLLVQNNL